MGQTQGSPRAGAAAGNSPRTPQPGLPLSPGGGGQVRQRRATATWEPAEADYAAGPAGRCPELTARPRGVQVGSDWGPAAAASVASERRHSAGGGQLNESGQRSVVGQALSPKVTRASFRPECCGWAEAGAATAAAARPVTQPEGAGGRPRSSCTACRAAARWTGWGGPADRDPAGRRHARARHAWCAPAAATPFCWCWYSCFHTAVLGWRWSAPRIC